MNTAQVIGFSAKSAEKLAQEYTEYKRIEKDAKKTLKEIQEQLIAIMDGAEELTAGLFIVKNTHFAKLQLDTKRFKAECPALYDQYCEQVDRTRFSVGV